MIRVGIRADRPLRGRANSGLWKPIETRKALLIGVANQRFTTQRVQTGPGRWSPLKLNLRPIRRDMFTKQTGKWDARNLDRCRSVEDAPPASITRRLSATSMLGLSDELRASL